MTTNKRGRPPLGPAKMKAAIAVRVRQDELDALKVAADARGHSVGEEVRHRLQYADMAEALRQIVREELSALGRTAVSDIDYEASLYPERFTVDISGKLYRLTDG